MFDSIKSESNRWALDCESKGPQWVDVLGTSYHLGLACRTFLTAEKWTKRSATETNLLRVAEVLTVRSSGVIFADEMVMAAILVSTEFEAEVRQIAENLPALRNFDAEKFLAASPETVRAIRNALAPIAGPIAQGYRAKGAKVRRNARMERVAAETEARNAAKAAKRAAKVAAK